MTYPNESASAWLAKAQLRKQVLASSLTSVANDLKRWLPSSWPLSESNVQAMLDTASVALEQGMGVMQTLAFENGSNASGNRTSASGGDNANFSN